MVLSKNILVFFYKMSESESDQDLNVSQYDVELGRSKCIRIIDIHGAARSSQGRTQVSINFIPVVSSLFDL